MPIFKRITVEYIEADDREIAESKFKHGRGKNVLRKVEPSNLDQMIADANENAIYILMQAESESSIQEELLEERKSHIAVKANIEHKCPQCDKGFDKPISVWVHSIKTHGVKPTGYKMIGPGRVEVH